MSTLQILAIPLLPLLGFVINGTLSLQQSRGKMGPQIKLTSVVACLMPFLSFLLALQAFFILKNNPELSSISAANVLDWMVLEDFSLKFGFLIDHLSSVMLLIITGVGSLIHLYSVGYMKADEAYSRYMSYINLFLFFMLMLVMGDSLVVLFVGWEGVGLCSYLLIGFWFTDVEKAVAGKKAFVANRIGDFAFLIGMFLIVATFAAGHIGSGEADFLSFSYLREHAHALLPVVTLITMCLLIGATGKSAQIPLYVWLPDAMAGPTPVSALIHAATMVTAGIYMIARLSFLFAMAPLTLNVVAIVGASTALLAALIAITQYDIKKVLAYSTVSQLGYMFLALGVGAYSAAIFHVMTHAFFKACLFLGSGSVIHSLHHEQDIRHMGGLLKKMPVTGWTFLVSTLAIAGLPGLSGFFSKDEILYMTFANERILYWVALFTAGLTAFYMMRVFIYTFLGECRYHHPDKIHESPAVMTLPLVVLAALAAVGGYVGLPHILGHNYFGEWLGFLGQKTPHHIDGSTLQEGHLMLMSASWGIICMALALYVYLKNPAITKELKKSFGALYRLMSDKFRVDELYEFLFIRPIHRVSESFLFRIFDVKIVDGFLVHGFVDSSWFVMRSLSLAQSGLLSQYLLYLLLGLGFVVVYVVFG